MSNQTTIAILVHKDDTFWSKAYFIEYLVREWEKKNVSIKLLQGPKSFIDADAVILHVDLTVISDDYLALLRRYPITINAQVRDISKRSFSSNLVNQEDGYEGPVIVKTDRNYGGIPERRIAHCSRGVRFVKHSRVAHQLYRRLQERFLWTRTGVLNPRYYPIYCSVQHVPRPVWNNNRLVVEKFLPEKLDGYYCLRQWVFFGDKEINTLSLSKTPIVKGANIVHREQVSFIPSQLRALRERLRFNYGKFDYVVVDGAMVLYDVNRTPKFGIRRPKAEVERMARDVAAGIRQYISVSTAKP